MTYLPLPVMSEKAGPALATSRPRLPLGEVLVRGGAAPEQLHEALKPADEWSKRCGSAF